MSQYTLLADSPCWSGNTLYCALLCTLDKYTVELKLFGLTGTARHPDVQEIRIIGFSFENKLHWQFEVGENLQTAVLGYIFIYVQIH
jgi:hypothetical protein